MIEILLIFILLLSAIACVFAVMTFFKKGNAVSDLTERGSSINGGNIERLIAIQNERLINLEKRVREYNEAGVTSVEKLAEGLAREIRAFSEMNAKMLEEMRFTVDEKLSTTLEKRLESSYNIIAENLRKVALGIGEVNRLAEGITDIKKVFGNVKLRGTWGEVQLGALLEQMLAKEQFVKNCRLNPNVDAFVDFAIVLPDKNGEKTYLPIDSKFPIEEYQRLIDSVDKTESEKLLATAIKRQADSISLKYIFPPLTTDFAIMYFPIEGLYAEAIKNDALMAYLHKKRIMACGPTNLGALLNSLQVGFKTVAIEQRSRELWQLLSAFKVEFEKFSLLLEKTGKKLSEAQDAIDLATKRTKTIGRKLSGVKDITDAEADEALIE